MESKCKGTLYSHLRTNFFKDWFFSSILAKAVPPPDLRKFSDKSYSGIKLWTIRAADCSTALRKQDVGLLLL